MLNKLNILLVLLIICFAIYAVILNAQINYLYKNNYSAEKKYNTILKINKQLDLEFVAKTSNIFVDKFATEELEMKLPKRVYSLDL